MKDDLDAGLPRRHCYVPKVILQKFVNRNMVAITFNEQGFVTLDL